jgi:hypothetical protein
MGFQKNPYVDKSGNDCRQIQMSIKTETYLKGEKGKERLTSCQISNHKLKSGGCRSLEMTSVVVLKTNIIQSPCGQKPLQTHCGLLGG